ncbi:MAG: PD-(D/E)XK nuclease-like domain-containing protein, partial [Candidatus Omnitrophica bacterium]|nr:PD-(D/E)XK nuclease-like domain-containing protein [Candidatus Omnitrophota bacterium]
FIAAASKEAVTDIEIIGFKQSDLDDALSTIEPNVKRIADLKSGTAEPDRCQKCDYCKSTKVLSAPIHFSELVLKP